MYYVIQESQSNLNLNTSLNVFVVVVSFLDNTITYGSDFSGVSEMFLEAWGQAGLPILARILHILNIEISHEILLKKNSTAQKQNLHLKNRY